jgi:hypothetical protein
MLTLAAAAHLTIPRSLPREISPNRGSTPDRIMPIRHLKLYHYPASRSARAKWMLHEVVGDAFEVESQRRSATPER